MLTIFAQADAPGWPTSTKRVALESAAEITIGGNGITGHDETSEDIATTWDTVFTKATPGDVPASINP